MHTLLIFRLIVQSILLLQNVLFLSLIYVSLKLVVNYCELLLVGLPVKYTNPIDRLIRQCVHVVFNLPRYTGNDISITSLMKNLKWLPISKHIELRICQITHKIINVGEPNYLANLVKPSSR